MKKSLYIFCFLTLAGAMTFADTNTATHGVTITMQDIALVALNNTTALTVSIAPTSAGSAPTVGTITNNDKYLRYTSVTSSTTRRITVQLNAGDVLPAGISIHLQADAPTGGLGILGTGTSDVSIGVGAQSLITGIRSGWTGIGATSGSKLTYNLGVDPATLGETDTTTVTVKFTIADS